MANRLQALFRVSDFANFSMETHFPNSSGPTHLGPVWAHPRGPGLGPPIWAQLGPTHGGPHISGSPERLTTLPQALFFFQKNGPHIFTSPELLGTLPQALFFFQKNGPPYFGGFFLELFAIAESETLNTYSFGRDDFRLRTFDKRGWTR